MGLCQRQCPRVVVGAEANVEDAQNHGNPCKGSAPFPPDMQGDQGNEKNGNQDKIDNKQPIERKPIIGEGAQYHGAVRRGKVQEIMGQNFHQTDDKERPKLFHLGNPNKHPGKSEGKG